MSADDSLGNHSEAAQCIAAGHFAAAQACYRALLQDHPDDAAALAGLGALAGAAGQHQQAAESLARACALDADNPLYLHNFGESLRQSGDLARAEAVFRKVIALERGFAPAYASLYEIVSQHYAEAKRRGDATQVAGLIGELSSLANRHGTALFDRGLLAEAVAAYRQALLHLPANASALSNLGNALRLTGQLSEAEIVCRQALSIDPGLAAAWNNLGNALVELGCSAEAAECYRQALARCPGFPEAVHNSGSGSLFNMLYRHDLSALEIADRHRQWGASLPPPVQRPFRRLLVPGRRLRVGYLSPDFRQHAMLHFLEPILAAHDRDRFEVFCYAQGPAMDAHTQRLIDYGHRWRWIHPLDDDALARLIDDDGIDLLVDCAGHTHGTRLRALARKPAPLMLSWLGYLFDSGLPAIDYRLTDEWVDPPAPATDPRPEQALRIPGGMLAYRPHRGSPPVAAAPYARHGFMTFGSFNNIQKFNPAVAQTWAKILQRVADSRLLLQSKHLADPGVCGRVRGLFEAFGIGPERLSLRAASADFLSCYGDLDVALDTFPYGGGATTCDALWMGVPVVTLSGDRPCGRLSTSLLNRVGCAQWIASSTSSYIDIACDLAARPDHLAEIRQRLRQQMMSSPLADERGFVTRLEEVYQQLAEQHDRRSA